ncbi:hypothetical protein IKF28_03090 [Candidatus Saccharibacteria bacterium]|nr:hypothetical protein [Candidatus Saccharibacteria bacterium]
MNKKAVLLDLSVVLALLLSPAFFVLPNVYAEDEVTESEQSQEESKDDTGTNISLTPVSKFYQLSAASTYDDTFIVNNTGGRELAIEVFAAPYSYVHSDETDSYQLGFSNENEYTQLSRWISFKDTDGSYKKSISATIAPDNSFTVNYRVSTPNSIPAGGQYAVIFARTTNGVTSSSGIRTEASPGMVIYGRSIDSESIIASEITDLKINQTITENEKTRNSINASAKIKNTGNVDFSANGKLVADGIIFGGHYESGDGNGVRISVIPESELILSDEWKDTPGFGIFKVTWTVEAAGETETIEQIVVINVVPVIILTIILLTIIIVWCIIRAKKRKERRSRLAV